jgi:hypothetical protein
MASHLYGGKYSEIMVRGKLRSPCHRKNCRFFLVRHVQWRATPPRTIFSLATVYTTYATGKFVVQSQKQSIGTEGVIQSSRVKYLGWYRTLHNLKI